MLERRLLLTNTEGALLSAPGLIERRGLGLAGVRRQAIPERVTISQAVHV
jgi:hypothetical protein